MLFEESVLKLLLFHDVVGSHNKIVAEVWQMCYWPYLLSWFYAKLVFVNGVKKIQLAVMNGILVFFMNPFKSLNTNTGTFNI